MPAKIIITKHYARHGMKANRTTTPEYEAWLGIKKRCYNQRYKRYGDWGGRGIVMCAGWINSPHVFFQAVRVRPSKEHSIDRKDNDGHYSCGKCDECLANNWPMNVRWATRKEQAANKRINHNSLLLTLDGETRTVSEWSRIKGIKLSTLVRRKRLGGMSDEAALTTPVRKYKPRITA